MVVVRTLAVLFSLAAAAPAHGMPARPVELNVALDGGACEAVVRLRGGPDGHSWFARLLHGDGGSEGADEVAVCESEHTGQEPDSGYTVRLDNWTCSSVALNCSNCRSAAWQAAEADVPATPAEGGLEIPVARLRRKRRRRKRGRRERRLRGGDAGKTGGPSGGSGGPPASYVEKRRGAVLRSLSSLQLPGVSAAAATSADAEASAAERRKLAEPHELRNLVLMVRFGDHASRALPSTSDFNVLFNADAAHAELAPTGSVREYFHAQSYGLLRVTSQLSGWVDVTLTEAEVAGGPRDEDGDPCNGLCATARVEEAIREALATYEAAAPEGALAGLDGDGDGHVDCFTVVTSGFGAETGGRPSERPNPSAQWVWSHRYRFEDTFEGPRSGLLYSSYNINAGLWGTAGADVARLGLVAHEMAHFLGLDDAYDSDESSFGAGAYDIMSDAWGVPGDQLFPGSLSAASKLLLGWLPAASRIATSSSAVEALAPEAYSLGGFQETGEVLVLPLGEFEGALALAADTAPDASGGFAEQASGLQVVVIENRRPSGWDRHLLDGGILVWHLDIAMVLAGAGNDLELLPEQPETWARRHFAVRLVQRDGLFELERRVSSLDQGDFWTSPTGNESPRWDDESSPNVQTYEAAAEKEASGHRLFNFSENGDTMSFSYEHDAVPREWEWWHVVALVLTALIALVLLYNVARNCAARRRSHRAAPAAADVLAAYKAHPRP